MQDNKKHFQAIQTPSYNYSCCNDPWEASPNKKVKANIYYQLSQKIQQFQHMFRQEKILNSKSSKQISQIIKIQKKPFNIKLKKNPKLHQKQNQEINLNQINQNIDKIQSQKQLGKTCKIQQYELNCPQDLRKKLREDQCQRIVSIQNLDEKNSKIQQNKRTFCLREKVNKIQKKLKIEVPSKIASKQSLNNLIFEFIENEKKNKFNTSKIFNKTLLEKKLR